VIRGRWLVVRLVGIAYAMQQQERIVRIVRQIVLVHRVNDVRRVVVSGRAEMAAVRPLMGKIARIARWIVFVKRA
jgi:hypothetical protein